MESGPSNPYSTPQAPPEPPVESGYLSPLPPYTPARLAIALGLICVGWLIVWAEAHDVFSVGPLLFVVIPTFFNLMAKVTNPHSQRTDSNFKWYHMVLWIGCFVAFIGFLWSDKPLPPSIKVLLMHPAALVLGWLISCGFLLNDWRKRRNNPPYQPKPHAVLPSKSVWKPFPRR